MADRFTVRGLSVRNRAGGLGIPLIIFRGSVKDNLFGSQAIPITAFLRLDGSLAELDRGTLKASLEQGRIPTSVDAMSPDDPLLKAIADMPLAPGVRGHSTIAVKHGKGDPHQGDDGVVAYRSAHLAGMRSELIVHSGHSCQDKPETIQEVRRILLLHLKEYDPAR